MIFFVLFVSLDFNFEVLFFIFLVEPPVGSQIYNLFHLTDPIAVRIEPLLCKQFKFIDPCTVPRYSKFPLGDGINLSLGKLNNKKKFKIYLNDFNYFINLKK